ncbi:unnamed protein product, partial [Iphiclides podalirius]
MLGKLFVIISAVLAVNLVGSFGKTCNDCILLSECPGAIYLAVYKKTPKTEGLIRSSLCSTETVSDIPKICCSEFPPAPSEIDNHPNLSLLPEDCGEIEGSRVVGGEVARLYEFPWMVLISYNTRLGKEFLCGGTLINSLYVLTAAHCIKDRKIAGVRLGDYNWAKREDCDGNTCETNIQDVGVAERIIHPSYRGPPLVRNDIALLRLRRPANVSLKNISPICLPVTQELRERNLVTDPATVAGWGLTENNTASTILLKVLVPVHTSEACKLYYNRNAKEDTTKNILCAGELGKDSCKGDSGGPLMLEGDYNGNFKIIQHGIVSHGPSQCGSKFPGVYTDVSWFMKWILDTIKS